jgi:diguanylate cyclase (GGDEF)-like protein
VVDRAQSDPFTEREQALLEEATQFVLRAIHNERVFVQLERTKLEQGKLYRAVGQLSEATSEGQVIKACVNSAREFTSFEFAAVTLFEQSSGQHVICAVSGEGRDALVGKRFAPNHGLVSMVVSNCHPLPYRGDYEPDRQVVFAPGLHPPPLPSLLVLPLAEHDRVLGTLLLGSRRMRAFSAAVRPTLEVLASHVAVSLSNSRMVKRLEELATTDGLTGLLNKRALVEAGAQKLRSANRFNKPLSLLLCDLDHFKTVNDVYGHDVGDVVIRGLSEVLLHAKRDTDVVGRFGGEEFVVVCEETAADGATLLAERIRKELADTTFHTEMGPVRANCSIGIATCPAAGTEWDALFKSADEALYAAKRAGRNRVTVWSHKVPGYAA